MFNNTAGAPVQGEDFFDREREQARMWDRLKTDNVLLLAPRRVGKTSLLYRLQKTAPSHDSAAVYVSVADVNTELAWVGKLYSAVQEQAGKRVLRAVERGQLGHVLKRVKKFGIFGGSLEFSEDAEQHWAPLGDALAHALNQMGKRWVLLVDELPIFVLSLLRQDPSGVRARNFLNWFRTLRTHPETAQHTRWVLAGSIGLDTVARRKNLGDTINDLYLFTDFGAFNAATADRLLELLSNSYQLPLPPEVRQHICSRVEWLIPYHLQLVFAELRALCEDDKKSATVEAVDKVFDLLLAPAKRGYFDYWEQRLREELGPPDDAFAIALLNAAAKDDHGVTLEILASILSKHVQQPDARDKQLRELLDVLQSDGYLVEDAGRFRFRTPLLRDFWRKRVSA